MADLFPSSIVSAEALGTSTIIPKTVSFSPDEILSSESFGSLVLLYDQDIIPDGLTSSETIPSHFVLPGEVTVMPTSIASLEDVPGATFIGPVLFPEAIISLEAFGTNLNWIFYIDPPSIPSGEDFSYIITFDGIPSEEIFGTTLFGITIQNSGGIVSQEAFGSHSVGNITLLKGIDTEEKFGIPSVFALEEFPCITPQLESIIPDFILEDHPNFVIFMEAYYEYLESHGQPVYDMARFPLNIDIDTTVDDFIEHFRKTFLVNLPSDLVTDKATLLKWVVEYYRSRGTEKSYQLFFRMLLGQEAEFFFPRVDILRPSDGKWIQNRTLKVLAGQGSPFDLKGRKIIGSNNNATAFVEKVQKVQEGSFTIYELFLNASSITGQFDVSETLTDIDSQGIVVETVPVVVDLNITYPGSGYEVGQEFEVQGTQGTNAIAKITKVDDATGEIQSIQMRSFGAGYYGTQYIDFSLNGTILDPADGEAIIGALAVYEGFFLNNDGFLSDTKYLQDGFYYQQFSYVTIVNASLDQYRDVLLKQLHPAGFKLFGLVRSQNIADSRGTPVQGGECSFINICRQPDLSTVFCGNTVIDSEVIRILDLPESVESFKSGHNYRSIERNKFYYKPYEPYNEDAEVSGSSNDGYWDQYANMQIKDVEHLIIEDFIDRPFKRQNITADPVIRHNPAEGDYGIPSAEHFGVTEVDTI